MECPVAKRHGTDDVEKALLKRLNDGLNNRGMIDAYTVAIHRFSVEVRLAFLNWAAV